MLTGAVPLDEAVQKVDGPFSLVFGNEASGLPDAFAQMGGEHAHPAQPSD